MPVLKPGTDFVWVEAQRFSTDLVMGDFSLGYPGADGVLVDLQEIGKLFRCEKILHAGAPLSRWFVGFWFWPELLDRSPNCLGDGLSDTRIVLVAIDYLTYGAMGYAKHLGDLRLRNIFLHQQDLDMSAFSLRHLASILLNSVSSNNC